VLNKFKVFCLIVFTLLVFFILLEVSLRLGGFIYLSLQERKNITLLQDKSDYRIVCLGDSMTAWGGSYSYPAQLQEILNKRGGGKRFSVINKGTPGASSTRVVGELPEVLAEFKPNIIVVMMGINDELYYSDYKLSSSRLHHFVTSLRLYKLSKLFYKHVKEIFLSKEERLIRLGSYLRYNKHEYRKAEKVLKQVVKINPKSSLGYKNLGLVFEDKGDFVQAEDAFKRAIFISPTDTQTFVYLGWLFEIQGRIADAQAVYNAALLIDANNMDANENLGYLYLKLGDYSLAEHAFRELIRISPQSDKGYLLLSRVFAETDRFVEAKKLDAIAQRVRSGSVISNTRENYLNLLNIILQRNILPVFVQYPLRNIAGLRGMFPNPDAIVFVDNQLTYRNALVQKAYSDIFTDIFAGDFGHCTAQGNRILAENIAEAILENLPKKQAIK